MNNNFSKKNRIIKAQDYKDIYKDGYKSAGKYLIINYRLLEDGSTSKLGITVSKKVDKKAVKRNYIKRVLREIIRKNMRFFQKKCEVVITAKKTIQNRCYREIEDDLFYLLEKSNILGKINQK